VTSGTLFIARKRAVRLAARAGRSDRALREARLKAAADAISLYRSGGQLESTRDAAWLALSPQSLRVRDDAWAGCSPSRRHGKRPHDPGRYAHWRAP
jgi:hypothetical protein